MPASSRLWDPVALLDRRDLLAELQPVLDPVKQDVEVDEPQLIDLARAQSEDVSEVEEIGVSLGLGVSLESSAVVSGAVGFPFPFAPFFAGGLRSSSCSKSSLLKSISSGSSTSTPAFCCPIRIATL